MVFAQFLQSEIEDFILVLKIEDKNRLYIFDYENSCINYEFYETQQSAKCSW